MTKKLGLYLLIIIIAIIGGVYLFTQKKEATAPAAPSVDNSSSVDISQERGVDIENFSFIPSELKIREGETVVWTNRDFAAHTIISDSGNELSSATLTKGKVSSHIFSSTGTFEYHCGIHPSMKAKIIVE